MDEENFLAEIKSENILENINTRRKDPLEKN